MRNAFADPTSIYRKYKGSNIWIVKTFYLELSFKIFKAADMISCEMLILYIKMMRKIKKMSTKQIFLKIFYFDHSYANSKSFQRAFTIFSKLLTAVYIHRKYVVWSIGNIQWNLQRFYLELSYNISKNFLTKLMFSHEMFSLILYIDIFHKILKNGAHSQKNFCKRFT